MNRPEKSYRADCSMADGLDYYQDQAGTFAIYPNRFRNPEYPALGLAGEVGEVCNKLKKIRRDGLNVYDVGQDVEAELGDVLWYLSQVCTELNLSLGAVAWANLDKLEDRRSRGVIQGSGDKR